MKTLAKRDTIKTLTTHYIDGAFVESHGREVMDIVRPTDGEVIAHVTLADEENTRRAIAAAKRSFTTFGGSTKEERANILRRLHEAIAARVDDLTDALVEEYGGPANFWRIMMGRRSFASSDYDLSSSWLYQEPIVPASCAALTFAQ